MNTFYPFYFLNFFKINKSVPNIGTLLKLFLQMIVVRTNDNIVAIGQPETQTQRCLIMQRTFPGSVWNKLWNQNSCRIIMFLRIFTYSVNIATDWIHN